MVARCTFQSETKLLLRGEIIYLCNIWCERQAIFDCSLNELGVVNTRAITAAALDIVRRY